MKMSLKGTNEQLTDNGIIVGCANKSTMQADATEVLDLPSLPPAARACDKFNDNILTDPLFSVVQVIQNGCTVHFVGNTVTVNNKDGQTVLTGRYNPQRRAYFVPLRQGPTRPVTETRPAHRAYGATVYEAHAVPTVFRYLHAAAGFPTKATWLKAIKNNHYMGWPCLTVQRVRKYLEKSEHTTNGHLHMIKTGIRSTQPVAPKEDAEPDPAPQPPTGPRSKTHTVGVFSVDATTLEADVTQDTLRNLIATDLPGRYPTTSARGHKYMFLMYNYDANYIYAVAIKSRKSIDLVKGFADCYTNLTKNNFKAHTLKLKTYNTNWRLQVTTASIRLNEPSKLTKITSSPHSAEPTPTSPQTVGTYFSPR